MSDYTKTVDFAAKDLLLTGNPSKLIKGTEIGAEFDAIATAVATKANSSTTPTLAQVQNSTLITLTTVAGTDTITAGAPDPFTAYADGQEFSFIAAGTNTGAATLNIDSVGAIDVKKQGGIALAAGDITIGAFVRVKYVSATGDFEMLGGASRVTAPAGSAALPSVSTTGDLNTGMWFPAADTIALSTGGAERLRIGSDGTIAQVAVAPLGYGTGAGGTVTQATSKATAVTLNKPTGKITMTADALAAGTIVSFFFNNSLLTANDILIMNHSAIGTGGAYTISPACTSGGATVSVRNNTAGSLSEAIVISFAVIKGATS